MPGVGGEAAWVEPRQSKTAGALRAARGGADMIAAAAPRVGRPGLAVGTNSLCRAAPVLWQANAQTLHCATDKFNKIKDLWRRGRDSNPRYPCEYAAFRVRCFQPLSHLSSPVESAAEDCR